MADIRHTTHNVDISIKCVVNLYKLLMTKWQSIQHIIVIFQITYDKMTVNIT